ncbi:CheR family methyltransferase [Gemmatimonadota bacterium]
MIKITPAELKLIINYIKDLSGINLDESKAYLIEGKLGPLAEELGCRSYDELNSKALKEPGNRIADLIIDAIANRETFFFRDKVPFELLKHKLLPDHIHRCNDPSSPLPRSLSIWSTACATGQEVYSIAMVVKEILPNPDKWRIQILGTDISESAIARSGQGRYSKFEMEKGLPPEKVSRFFNQDGDFWRIKDEIRAMVGFKKFNLMHLLADLGRFDIIFCRNVAIYFSPEDRKSLFNRIADQLKPQGILILGSTESLYNDSSRYRRLEYNKTVYYRGMDSTPNSKF